MHQLFDLVGFFAVPSEFRECGLPKWIANRPQWTTLDAKFSLQMMPESSRRFKILNHGGGRQKSFSQMTCKKIIEGLAHDDRKVKLVAYEKRGW